MFNFRKITEEKYRLMILAGILIIAFVLALEIFNIPGDRERQNSTQSSSATYQTKTGKKGQTVHNLTETQEYYRQIIAVSIDNQTQARPLYGLNAANIIYEMPIEGKITRFLALFIKPAKTDAEKIGPVRSVRPYMVEIAKEYNALLAHAGGSPQALKLIKQLKLHNLEEIAWWGPDYFWRVYSRPAPHNLFTALKKLRQAVKDWKLDTGLYSKTIKANQTNNNGVIKTAHRVQILFSPQADYQPAFIYQKQGNDYIRYVRANKQIDALDHKPIRADAIIIQFLPEEKIIDKQGRLELNLSGSGKFLLFKDGYYQTGRWSKKDIHSSTVFRTAEGEIIDLKNGLKWWVELVPKDIKVKIN